MFITSKNHQTQRLEFLQKKLGSCIFKAKPYYEASLIVEKLQFETQKAAIEFQKANSLYKIAKETLVVAENSLDKRDIPDAWQEHLSTTVTKINNSKKLADQAEEHHRQKACDYQMAEKKLQNLEKELKRHINKSKTYYEEKFRWNTQMESQKMRIYELEKALMQAKISYKEAMINLSKISEEIHNKRNLQNNVKSESQSTNNANTKADDTHLKKYFEHYKIQLPNEKEQTNREKISNYLNGNDLKSEILDEYVSLGLNSTASNSRCSSPSANSLGIIDDHQTQLTMNQAISRLELFSNESDLSSKTNSFSSSSMSHGSSNEIHSTFAHKTQPPRSLTVDTGFQSISSESDAKANDRFEENHQQQNPANIKITKTSVLISTNDFNSNVSSISSSSTLSSESVTKSDTNFKFPKKSFEMLTINNKIENSIAKVNNYSKKVNQETPLLNNLLLDRKTKF